MRKIPLYTKILIGFVLGVIFGIIFKVDHHELTIAYNTQNAVINNWSEFTFAKKDSVLKSFDAAQQIGITKYFENLKKNQQLKDVILKVKYPDSREDKFENVKSLGKTSSIGADIKPIGEVFIRLLNMIAIPLVLASLIVGAASLHDIKHVAKIGGKMLAIYGLTAILAVSLGQGLATIIQPGKMMPPEAKTRLIESYQDEYKTSVQQQSESGFDAVSFLVNIVPKNPIKALADGDFLQIVFFAILTGLILCVIPKEKAKPVIDFFSGLSEAMIKLVEKVILIAPYAVFALIAATVAEFGFEILHTLLWYTVTVVLGLFITTFIIYPLILKIFTRVSIIDFFLAQKQVLAVAFTTSSSSATLPVTFDVTEKKLGVPNRIASFILPLGTTINKDGTALYQAVAAVFIAQVYGFDLSFAQQLSIFISCIITGAATAPVAGAGLIMLVVVLKAVGLPEEGIALIIGIDRFLNMCRAVPNVVGDTMCSVVVASTEGELGEIKTKD